MKHFIFTAIVGVILTSCGSSRFYQIYQVDTISSVSKTNDALVYEDDNCEILYNFWGQGGNAGFHFYNKTDENIYINMDESFFICNGIAYNYYKNRIFTYSQSSLLNTSKSNTALFRYSSSNVTAYSASNIIGLLFSTATGSATTKGKSISSGSSTAYIEEKTICIPPKTTKIIAEYSVTESLYRDCNLFKYPSKKRIRTSEFSVSESPFVFSNKIAYTIGTSENLLRLENKFYVSEITNYPQREIIVRKIEQSCDEDGFYKDYFKDSSPDKFYIEYEKDKTSFKH
jgi:hypothetical protein